jgi:CPA1 family monovalent cation:H+ antiporter
MDFLSHMSDLELLLALLVIMLGLVVLARRIGLADPIVLVTAGLALALLPIWPEIDLEPELVFTVFLPPILFSAAYSTSWRDFRRQFGSISFLAIGLVLVTMVAVAIVAHAVIPGLSWATAFVLGAIVSPPDAVATVAIVQRLGVPRRVVTVLEGESLVNDATALVSYRFAVAAVVTGAFSLGEAGFHFVFDVAGGLLVGYIVGRLAIWAVPYLATQAGVLLTFVASFSSYLLGETIGASGVLATVVTGLVFGRSLPAVGNAQLRVQSHAIWDQVVFVINGLVFMLIGLELQQVLANIEHHSYEGLLWYAIAVSLCAILIRVVWVMGATVILQWVNRNLRPIRVVPSTTNAVIIAWAGLRGVVTLATALALPLVTASGAPFDDRDLIIFLAFAVILVTLLGQGLTLGPLVKRLAVASDTSLADEEALARREAWLAALDRLERLAGEAWVPANLAASMRAQFEGDLHQSAPARSDWPRSNRPAQQEAQRRLSQEVLSAQREAVIRLRDSGQISDEVVHHIFHELDLAELHPAP